MKRKSGFTLVELMIVIIIIGSLMAYAIPAYNRNVIRSKRVEGQNRLMEIAAAQEKHMATFNQYATALGGPISATNLGISPINTTNYSVSFSGSNATNGFRVRARGRNNSTQRDDNFNGLNCRNMFLDGLGRRTPLNCWQ